VIFACQESVCCLDKGRETIISKGISHILAQRNTDYLKDEAIGKYELLALWVGATVVDFYNRHNVIATVLASAYRRRHVRQKVH
jgi:hypothetical protein